jgi:hypothetical protein
LSATKKTTRKKRTSPHSLTRAKQAAFLEAVAIYGTITRACVETDVGRRTHYDWLETETYAKAFIEAEKIFADRVRDAVRLRAVDGWQEPVIYQGQYQFVNIRAKNGTSKKQMVTVRKFSDRLLELLAKAKCPEFRDKLEVGGKDGKPIEGKITIEFVKPVTED